MLSAPVGAKLRLRPGILAESSDQLGRVVQRGAVWNMDVITQSLFSPAPLVEAG